MADSVSPRAMERVLDLQRSCDAEEIRLGRFDVVAGGALPWREVNGKLQVLLIHRPKYDDWSWPKGKLDPGESIAECAVREVREEIGLHITLGLPLAATAYHVNRKPKVVYYWAAAVEQSAQVMPDGSECDQTRWVSCAKAAEMLTNPSDVGPLEDLIAAYQGGYLRSVPFLLVRHAKAKPRGKWTRAEGERPLAATGRRQAQAVCRLLEAWKPTHVASSPWVRCVQTITPYVSLHQLKLRTKRSLTEHAALRNPQRAAHAVQKLLDKHRSQVLCTHRPVLPALLVQLRRQCTRAAAALLPTRDPYLEPGSMLVLHQVPGAAQRIVSVEIHSPFHD